MTSNFTPKRTRSGRPKPPSSSSSQHNRSSPRQNPQGERSSDPPRQEPPSQGHAAQNEEVTLREAAQSRPTPSEEYQTPAADDRPQSWSRSDFVPIDVRPLAITFPPLASRSFIPWFHRFETFCRLHNIHDLLSGERDEQHHRYAYDNWLLMHFILNSVSDDVIMFLDRFGFTPKTWPASVTFHAILRLVEANIKTPPEIYEMLARFVGADPRTHTWKEHTEHLIKIVRPRLFRDPAEVREGSNSPTPSNQPFMGETPEIRAGCSETSHTLGPLSPNNNLQVPSAPSENTNRSPGPLSTPSSTLQAPTSPLGAMSPRTFARLNSGSGTPPAGGRVSAWRAAVDKFSSSEAESERRRKRSEFREE